MSKFSNGSRCLNGRRALARMDAIFILNIGLILCGTLLPFLQKSREVARENECKSRLSKLTLAALDYVTFKERLPSVLCQQGCVPFSDWSDVNSPLSQFKVQNAYWTQIMPYLPGYDDVAETLDPFFHDGEKTCVDYVGADQQPVYKQFSDIKGFWEIAYTDCPAFVCPSDNINEEVASPIFVIQPISRFGTPGEPRDDQSGKGYFTFSTPSGKSSDMGRTNYGPAAGACSGGLNRGGELGVYVGATGPREKLTLAEIKDGTSTTILHGETLGGIKPDFATGIPVRTDVLLVVGGGLIRGRGDVPWKKSPPLNKTSTPTHPKGNDPEGTILGNTRLATAVGFSSAHPRGVVFTFVDGSVRLIPRTIRWQQLYSLYGRADGEAVEKPKRRF